MPDENTFGNMLKSLRTRKGTKRGTQWTQTQVAEKLEVSRATYNYWENGVRLPSDDYLEKIVELFKPSQEDVEELYRLKSRVSPALHTLPFLQNHFFTGRVMQLKRLGLQLQEHGSVAINQPVSISGLGGIGKTQLALEYAHRSYPDVYRAVFWMKSEDEPTLQAEYDNLAQLLGLPERSEHDPMQRVQSVNQWLENHTEWLLVLDNADDLYLARKFLPAKPRGHIVVTTRSQAVSALGTKAMHIEIEEMEPAEGLFFVLRRAGLVDDDAAKIATLATNVRDEAEELVALLGGHPLALDQAGAYVEETGVAFADYIQLYQKERHYLLSRRGLSESEYSDHPASVAATIALSFRRACEKQPVAADLLHFCSFLQPDAMPEELLRRADGLTLDTVSFNEAIAALQQYSLIKHNFQEKLLSIHRLVQETLISSMSLDLRKQWFLCVQRTLSRADKEVFLAEKRLLEKSQSSIDKNVKTRPPKSRRYWFSHAQSALRRADAPGEDISFFPCFPSSTIIKLFLEGIPVFSPEERRLSELKYREAELQEQLSLAEKEYGANDIRSLNSLLDLRDIYIKFEKYDQAAALYVRIAKICERYPERRSIAAAVEMYMSHMPTDQHGVKGVVYTIQPEKADCQTAIDMFGDYTLHTRKIQQAEVFFRTVGMSENQVKYEEAIVLYEQPLSAISKFWNRPSHYYVITGKKYIILIGGIGRDVETADVMKFYLD